MNTVIFDFDGTIADTHESIIASMRETASRLCVGDVDTQLVTSLIGKPLRECIRIALGCENPEALDNAVSLYRQIYGNIALQTVRLYPGVMETLRELKAQGFRLAIATSRGRDSLRLMLVQLEIRDYFTVIRTEEDVERKKPAPDMVISILEEINCAPTDALVVGDTIFDIEMGKGAGTVTCAVTYGNHNRELLAKSHPDLMIDSMPEMLASGLFNG